MAQAGIFLAACLVYTSVAAASSCPPFGSASVDLASASKVDAAQPDADFSSSLEWQKTSPFSFSVDYTIVSDYIFRGANFSEYSGEGREKVNHQMGLGLELDTARLGRNLGTFGFSIWGEWYADQESVLTPTSSGSLQEVDYTIYWSYELSEIYTTLELGWIAYTFPQAGHDAFYTNEPYISLSFDDSPLFGTEESILNPYVAYYLDTDDIDGGWLELGISHDFALGDLGLADTPVLAEITITPSFILGIDDGQMGKSMRLANLHWGLDIAYDLNTAMNISPEYGSMSLTAFLYFSDAIHDAFLNDELYGGVTLGYSW